mgnify:CR=1 FL=1
MAWLSMTRLKFTLTGAFRVVIVSMILKIVGLTPMYRFQNLASARIKNKRNTPESLGFASDCLQTLTTSGRKPLA